MSAWNGDCVRAALLASVASVAVATSDAAWAQTRAFDVPAQPAASGVAAFARQADVQILVSAADAAGRRTNAVRGTFTTPQALNLLLATTGLVAQPTGAQTYTVMRGPPAEPGLAVPVASTLDEVVVTGSHIRGVTDLPTPTFTLDADDIRRAGFSTLEGMLEQLPQNFAEVTPEGRFANEGGSRIRGQNNTQVTAIDLRGLGPQSTLTLVNGARPAGSIGGRVVDVSAIPLSVIDRVEIVTGGRSAVYGADAVAGVVNLITRREFEGFETQVYYGWGEKGGERAQASQTFGARFDRGGFVVAYDVSRDWRLNLADRGLLTLQNNPVIDVTVRSLNAQADAWRQSVYAAGRYELNDRVELYADGLFTFKKSKDSTVRYFLGAVDDSFGASTVPTEHYNLTAGLRTDLGRGWRLNLSGTGSRSDETLKSHDFVDAFGLFTILASSIRRDRSDMNTASAVMDGPLPTVMGVAPRLAAGLEVREEGFKASRDGASTTDADRTVRSAFAELLLPLAVDRPGLRRLEVSFAGRLDDYSDFGSTFNPQAGLVWSPAAGLTLRGAYSEAFRAPALIELTSDTAAFLELADNPSGGAPVPVLFVQGTTAGLLKPEEAKTWSIGFDYQPPFARWSKLSVSYFDIKYDGRIEQPTINNDRQLILQRADRFPGLITRQPTAAQADAFLAVNMANTVSNDTGRPWNPATQSILSVFPDLVLFDNRTVNIAVEKVRGVDVQWTADFATAMGDVNLGVNATYTIDHDRSLTDTSPGFSLLNEVGKPVDFRARASAGWTRGPYQLAVYVNHVDGYRNPFSSPPSKMSSWTTVDLSAGVDTSRFASGSPVGDLRIQVNVTNLFDEAPPVFPNSLLGLRYDSANANPIGRYMSVRLVKAW